jgi:hypothetical protein
MPDVHRHHSLETHKTYSHQSSAQILALEQRFEAGAFVNCLHLFVCGSDLLNFELNRLLTTILSQ